MPTLPCGGGQGKPARLCPIDRPRPHVYGRLMRAFVMQLHRMVLLAVLTLSLVATGFAHRLPGAEEQTAAAMLAAGATPSDICGEFAPSNGHANGRCEACQIAGGADIPPRVAAVFPAAMALVAEVTAPRESRHATRVLDPVRTPQGPPVA